jgi:S-adenosylmethionine synthetase
LNLIIRKLESAPPWSQRVEVVERKGIGHPDTICDGVAEHICVRLCRYYLDHFGFVLHHNLDKVLLCGGSAEASFGGGETLHPIEIYIAGRATQEYRGERIPVYEIAEEACRDWVKLHIPTLNIEQNLTITPRIRPGSRDLIQLFQNPPSAAASNDTSCGSGFAPLTDLERVVLEVEHTLNEADTKRRHPAIGFDIKVMGVRQDNHIDLTISCALIGRFVANLDDYVRQKSIIRLLALDAARRVTSLYTDAIVNAADDLRTQNLFLTVTGTSAEAGDDGEAGRGNRTSGLITPYRAMTMEASAGKNPVTHVGKLYNLLAARIAGTIVAKIDGVANAECVLVSQIGRPVADPHLADVSLNCREAIDEHRVTDVVHAEIARLAELRDDLLAERLPLF